MHGTMLSVDIGQAGEGIVADYLRNKGYSVEQNTRLPGSSDIEARGNPTSLLVQVKTSLHPNDPPFLGNDEVGNIRSRATRLGWEAWSARLQVNHQGYLVGEILWTKLN